LKLRGPGDIDGTQQSGIAFNLRIADLTKDGQILSLARDLAIETLEDDAALQKPENILLSKQLEKLNRQRKMGWFMIS